MRRTTLLLADGRELIHYDADGAPPRTARDARALEGRGAAPTMRHDPLLDDWVSVAAHRMGRTFLPAADDCPLCPSRDGRATEVPSDDYDVVVFENRFPSFAGAADAASEQAPGGPLHVQRPAGGRCEVVCFTSDHDGSFAGLDVDRARLVVEAWADRTAALTALPGVEQVFVFENKGEAIGVTLRHPHGQIYAYPYMTSTARRHHESVERHLARTGRNLYDDVIGAELADGRRVVQESEHWLAFVPFAARWPVEAHLYPRRRVPDLAALTPAERDDLAVAYLGLLRRGEAFYGVPLPFIAAWHQSPVAHRADGGLHLELLSVQRDVGRLKYLAGSESAMGAFVNDRAPEEIAARLRAVEL